MKCHKCDVEIQGRKEKKFCSDKCRLAAWADAHVIKRKHPKRIRSRERERLYVIIHKGETIEQLRAQAREASRVQALRGDEYA
jgi:heterodisulfide reductase subunit A-like polyferredoxin